MLSQKKANHNKYILYDYIHLKFPEEETIWRRKVDAWFT